jgi:hypothetical protein
MKIGLLEIVLIIFVVIAVIIIARIVRPSRFMPQDDNGSGTDTKAYIYQRSKILGRTGIALMLAGGIALIAGASMLQWVLHNYVLSSVLIVCGVVIFMLSRQKR